MVSVGSQLFRASLLRSHGGTASNNEEEQQVQVVPPPPVVVADPRDEIKEMTDLWAYVFFSNNPNESPNERVSTLFDGPSGKRVLKLFLFQYFKIICIVLAYYTSKSYLFPQGSTSMAPLLLKTTTLCRPWLLLYQKYQQ